MSEIQNPTSKQIADGAFGLLLILSVLWFAGGFINAMVTHTSIPWGPMLVPFGVVLVIQFFFIWITAVIRSAVAGGLVLGLTELSIREEVRARKRNIRENLN